MSTLADHHQPSFVMWPLQNARTAFAPVYLPIILVVPHRRHKDGSIVPNSEVYNVTFRIEQAPGRAKVAGYQYRGILVPQFERYRIELSALDLSKHKINVLSQVFERDGVEIDSSDAIEGDLFSYTTEQGNLIDKIKYLPDADYYDLSPISIETEGLKPLGKYIFSWCANYYRRVITVNDELFCIDTSMARLARHAVIFDHPGDVHNDMFEKTPSWVFNTTTALHTDPTFKFYRPFADVLNDIFDESAFLETINHVDHIPASLVPYLAHLIGWDLPYFPGASDEIRARVLKNARRLQALKGSKQAIRELFDIFQFTVELINLWYNTAGTGFIAPNDPIADPITAEDICRSEPLLVNYSTDGYGQIDIPLLYRPLGNVTIEAWLVKTSSPVYTSLMALSDSVDNLEGGACAVDGDGYQIGSLLHGSLSSGSVIGYSKVLINQTVNASIKSASVGFGPLSSTGIKYDTFKNQCNVTFDRYMKFAADEKLFIYATYQRELITIPESLADLRSNRFDIRILERAHGEEVNPQVLEFLVDFIHRLKAFHSLLRKILFNLNLADVYAVTDFCVGGDVKQRPGTIAGETQVPPAIIPTDLTVADCDLNLDRGFKEADFTYRDMVLSGLEEEFAAWKSLDGKYDITNRALYESLSRVTIPSTGTDTDCQWNNRGQDRKITADIDPDHDIDIRTTACELTTDDFCFQGRVTGELETSLAIPLDETWRFAASCSLNMGKGLYYTMPYISESWCPNSTGCIAPDELAALRRSHLERLLARVIAFSGVSLKYTDKSYFDSTILDNKSNWAMERPSLMIQKDNLFIPGHRYPTMGRLSTNFTHPQWNLRPWDDVLNVKCPEDAPAQVTLDSELIVNTNGDEELVFDVQPLVYYGNSLTPDIPSLGDHSMTSIPLVTHKIFTTARRSEYVDLDGVVYTEDLATEPPTTVCLPDEIGKVFDSAVDA